MRDIFWLEVIAEDILHFQLIVIRTTAETIGRQNVNMVMHFI